MYNQDVHWFKYVIKSEIELINCVYYLYIAMNLNYSKSRYPIFLSRIYLIYPVRRPGFQAIDVSCLVDMYTSQLGVGN